MRRQERSMGFGKKGLTRAVVLTAVKRPKGSRGGAITGGDERDEGGCALPEAS